MGRSILYLIMCEAISLQLNRTEIKKKIKLNHRPPRLISAVSLHLSTRSSHATLCIHCARRQNVFDIFISLQGSCHRRCPVKVRQTGSIRLLYVLCRLVGEKCGEVECNFLWQPTRLSCIVIVRKFWHSFQQAEPNASRFRTCGKCEIPIFLNDFFVRQKP